MINVHGIISKIFPCDKRIKLYFTENKRLRDKINQEINDNTQAVLLSIRESVKASND